MKSLKEEMIQFVNTSMSTQFEFGGLRERLFICLIHRPLPGWLSQRYKTERTGGNHN